MASSYHSNAPNWRRLCLCAAVAGIMLFAPIANATPDPWAEVRDTFIGADADRYVVMRLTQLHFGTYYQYRDVYEMVEISVWDGRVLNRCVLHIVDAHDTTANGDWVYENTGADPGCTDVLGSELAAGRDINLLPDVSVTLSDEGAVLLHTQGDSRILATVDFVQTRLAAMTAGEREACLTQEETWPMFGGCHLPGYSGEYCSVYARPRTTREVVFMPIHCAGQSLYWLAVGRAYWDAHVP